MACCKCIEHKWDDPQDVVYTDVETGKEYCVFHAPSGNKSVSDLIFNRYVFERINAAGENCDLSGAIFPAKIRFDQIINDNCSVDFEFCQFLGGIIFEEVDLYNELSFSSVVFKGGIYIKDSVFRGAVSFINSDLYGISSIEGSRFHGEVTFYQIKINSDIMLSDDFFYKESCFISCSVDGICLINNPSFFDNFIIGACKISSSKMIIRGADMYWVDFTANIMGDIEIINSCWPIEDGRIHVRSEDEVDELQAVRDFYQQMKRKYKDEHNEYEASKWHIAEKEAQLKLLKQNHEPQLVCLILWLYKKVSRFGEDPTQAAKVLGSVILFAWMLLGVGGITDGEYIIQGIAYPNWENIQNFGTVFITLFKHVMLFKLSSIEYTSVHGWAGGTVLVFTRLIIPILAAMFGLAVRNRFRR